MVFLEVLDFLPCVFDESLAHFLIVVAPDFGGLFKRLEQYFEFLVVAHHLAFVGEVVVEVQDTQLVLLVQEGVDFLTLDVWLDVPLATDVLVVLLAVETGALVYVVLYREH